MRKKSRLGLIKVSAEEKSQTTPKISKREYRDVLPQREMEIADGVKLVFNVSATSEGRPHLDIRTWINSDKYTGPTKKGINFDIENIEEFKEIIEKIYWELEEEKDS